MGDESDETGASLSEDAAADATIKAGVGGSVEGGSEGVAAASFT